MRFLSYLLFPVVPVYFVVTWMRNVLYDVNLLKSKSYAVPIICVGNLSVGGTGKTPMIEYLIRLLQNHYRLATLSRGYKRQSSGFILANEHANAQMIGDEPFQFFTKFKNVTVAVDANRQHGIERLLELEHAPEVILLDDALQHRKVQAGLNILLTTYSNLYSEDIVLPTGDLREPRSGAKRAQVVVVTKCPSELSEAEQSMVSDKLRLQPHQSLFFSAITYSESIVSATDQRLLSDLKKTPFTLVTGIANAEPLVAHLRSNDLVFEHLNYKDHHQFSEADLNRLKTKELIVTTEKDYMRLKDVLEPEACYYLPIELKLFNRLQFNEIIQRFVSH